MLTSAGGGSGSSHLRTRLSRVVGYETGQDPLAPLLFLFFSDTSSICSLIRWCLLAGCGSKPSQGCSEHSKNAPPHLPRLFSICINTLAACHSPSHHTQLRFRRAPFAVFPTTMPRECRRQRHQEQPCNYTNTDNSFADIPNGSLVILGRCFVPYRANCIQWKREIKKVKWLLKESRLAGC